MITVRPAATARLLLLMLVTIIPCIASAADTTDSSAILAEAERLYAEAQNAADRDQRLALFAQARLQYARLAESGIENASLLSNIGNAALRAEDLGQAILAYRRALTLDPDHRQAKQNLDHARGLLPAWVTRPSQGGLLDSFFFWHRTLSRSERALAAAACFALALTLLSVAVLFRKPLYRNLAILPALACAALLVSTYAAGESRDDAVVVARGGEPAFTEDHSRGAQVYPEPLPAGTELTIVERRGEWLRVRVGGTDRDAWLRAGSVAMVE